MLSSSVGRRIAIGGLLLALSGAALSPAMYRAVERLTAGRVEPISTGVPKPQTREELEKLVSTLSPTYRQEVDSDFHALATTPGYVLFVTAEWCGPCKELERFVDEHPERGRFDKVRILDNESTISKAELAYIIEKLDEHNIIRVGAVRVGVPLVVANENDRLSAYIGFNNRKQTMYRGRDFSLPVDISRILRRGREE